MDGYGSDDGKPNNEQKYLNYQIFSKESIELFAQSVNISTSLDGKVLPLLSEDVIYRLRELINNSNQYCRHSKRGKLTCDDVNKALRHNDSPEIYGYGHGLKPLKEVYSVEAKVFTVEEESINLTLTSESIINKTYQVNLLAECPQYRIDWLCVDGRIIRKEFNPPGPEEKPSPEHLQLMGIFNSISKGIVSHNSSTFHATLSGLSSTANVQHILSLLVKFIANNIVKGNHVKTLRQLLMSIKALSKNSYLQITSDVYMTPLVKSVLHCILRSGVGSYDAAAATNACEDVTTDLWNLKVFASIILNEMFKEWSSSFLHNKFYNQVIRALLTSIKDPSQSYLSHYGVIVTFTRLGFDCVMNHLYHHLGNYCNNLNSYLENSLIATNHGTKYAAHQVRGALLNLAILLVLKFREMALTEDNYEFHHIVKELLGHFGDALAIQLPTDPPEPEKVYSQQVKPKMRSCLPSGEELLDTFYENHSGSPPPDDYDFPFNSVDSIDEKSNESEKDLIRNDGSDLLVESTISDPTLGVKLTIKKIRRSRRSSDDIETLLSSKSTKKWKKAKVQNFMECFAEECEDLLLEEARTKGNLYGHRIVKKNLSPPFQPTPWYLIGKKLKVIGKQQKKNSRNQDNQWRNKLFSCTVNVIL